MEQLFSTALHLDRAREYTVKNKGSMQVKYVEKHQYQFHKKLTHLPTFHLTTFHLLAKNKSIVGTVFFHRFNGSRHFNSPLRMLFQKVSMDI